MSDVFTDCPVIVVDDEPDCLLLMSLVLEAAGAKVSCFDQPADALQALNSQQPALALLDLQMPGMSGYDLLNAIRAHPNPVIRNMPVVCITAHAYSQADVLAKGFNAYIPKPVRATRLLDQLRRVMVERTP